MSTSFPSRPSSPFANGNNEDSSLSERIDDLIATLASRSETEAVASELGVLQSIYGEESIRPWQPPVTSTRVHGDHPPNTIRYEVHLNFPSPHDDVLLRILVSLPPSYPTESPPQLQLLSRYIGNFGVDSELFGSILKTFISVNGVEWTPDTPCVFDGLEAVKERCLAWYEEHLSLQKAGEMLREDAKEHHTGQNIADPSETVPVNIGANHVDRTPPTLPEGIALIEAPAIVDRKSSFVGRACHITDPAQVPLILSYLLSDRRIAKAAHPIINAWRVKVGAILHQDNDDDGETAAGGRLAHLLQILDVNDVLVVVTRYWGGTLLGPDRFKHINQAARDALEAGGFLNTPDTKRHEGRGKRSH